MHTRLRRIAVSTIAAIAAIVGCCNPSNAQVFRSMAECEAQMQALIQAGKGRCIPLTEWNKLQNSTVSYPSQKQYEEYLRSLRRQMGQPHIHDPELKAFAKEQYRSGARIGSGSTADAIRYEKKTGLPIKDRWHNQKGEDAIRFLEKWLRKNPTARLGDRAAAENMLLDLKDALGIE
jgi:filamentous hemagglutinin